MVLNVKWGIYSAVAAFLLAFTTSLLLGQASFASALLRGLAFAAVFFVLGAGVWTLINTFIPELLVPETDDAAASIFGSESADLQGFDSESYGSRINITLGDGTDAALPDQPDYDEVGNIADLVSGAVGSTEEAKKSQGLDQSNKNSYTNEGVDVAPSPDGFAEPVYSEESSGFTMNFDDLTTGSGEDPFEDSFSLPADVGSARKEEALPERKVTGNTPKKLEGDFNPKDIALGIRTVLENDKKG